MYVPKIPKLPRPAAVSAEACRGELVDKVMGYVEYRSNNSGGGWWLSDDDWRNLEAAGWEVQWFANEKRKLFKPDKDGRCLGALASSAKRRGLPLRDAMREFERITRQNAADQGCNCCGNPHDFTEYDDDDRHVASSYDLIVTPEPYWE